MKRTLLSLVLALALVGFIARPAEATFKPCNILPWLCQPSITPSPSPSVTPAPSVSVAPTGTGTPFATPPANDKWQLGGPPPAPVCKPLDLRPTVVWLQRDGGKMEVTWSTVEDYVSVYVVEYSVNGIVYTTTIEGENAVLVADGRIDKVRVASLNSGCQGKFSEWAGESLPAGSK